MQTLPLYIDRCLGTDCPLRETCRRVEPHHNAHTYPHMRFFPGECSYYIPPWEPKPLVVPDMVAMPSVSREGMGEQYMISTRYGG